MSCQEELLCIRVFIEFYFPVFCTRRNKKRCLFVIGVLRLRPWLINCQSWPGPSTVRPSGEITTTFKRVGSSPDSSQPGFPPGIVNSIPEESARVMQGFPAAVRNIQLLGRYLESPPLSSTAVPRARFSARLAANGSVGGEEDF